MPKRSREQENPSNDEELFHRAVSDVKRLAHNQTPASSRPVPSSLRLRKDSTADIENEEVGRFLRPGVQTTALQKLRRGQFPIGAMLDLHGYTSIEADGELRKFSQVRKHVAFARFALCTEKAMDQSEGRC